MTYVNQKVALDPGHTNIHQHKRVKSYWILKLEVAYDLYKSIKYIRNVCPPSSSSSYRRRNKGMAAFTGQKNIWSFD